MKRAKFRTVAVIAVFSSLAMASPAQAASICEQDANSSFYAWFAWSFGYCKGHMD